MCLAIPGKVVRWIERDPLFARAEVEFAALRRVCHMACVPDAREGDYVLVHAGIGIARVDAAEAQRLLEELRRLGEDGDWPDDETPPLDATTEPSRREPKR